MKKNYTGIILGVLGVVFGLLGYLLVWNNLTEKTDILNGENASLQEEVDRLQDLADHKEQYENDTRTMKERNEEIISEFPAEVRAEDEILYADKTEKNYVTTIKAVAMPGPNKIEVAAPAADTVAADEGSEEGSEETTAAEDGEVVEDTSSQETVRPSIDLFQTPVTISFDASYETVKDIISEITADKTNKKSLDVVAINFSEETGDLEGTMTYSMYSLTGTEKTYSEPAVSGVGIGTSNLFNTVERKAKIEAERRAEGAAKAAAAAESAGE